MCIYLLYPDCFNMKFHIAAIDGALGTVSFLTFSVSDASFYAFFHLEYLSGHITFITEAFTVQEAGFKFSEWSCFSSSS